MFGAAPSIIDQAATALVVALEDTNPGEVSIAAVNLLKRFDPADRMVIATSAVQLGADAKSVSNTLMAAGQVTPAPIAPVVTAGASQSPKYVIGGLILAAIGAVAWIFHKKAA